MKKMFNKILPTLLIGALLIGFGGCKENTLVIPDQIPLDKIEVKERGPVKQNSFKVITEDDEKIRFDISNVDQEMVETVYFSHNHMGEKVTTEVKDFESIYIIENLPVGTPTSIEVWAKGKNGIDSKKFAYVVNALPYPAKVVSNGITAENGVFSGSLKVTNLTRHPVSVYYKLENESSYKNVRVNNPEFDLLVSLGNLEIGTHVVNFYVKDDLGGESEVRSASFESETPPIVSFTTKEQKQGWTPWAPNGYAAGFAADRAIDGEIGAGYEFVSGSNANPFIYQINFTKTRITTDLNYNNVALKTPSTPYDLIVVKSVVIHSGAVEWGINPSMAFVYGILENGDLINFGSFSSPTAVNTQNPFSIDLSGNTQPLKGIRLDIVNSLTSPTNTGVNINEINLTGFKM